MIARSFARIHRTNLINFGVLPLTFAGERGPEGINQGDELVIRPKESLADREETWYTITNCSTGEIFEASANMTEREREIYAAGGLLNLIKNKY